MAAVVLLGVFLFAEGEDVDVRAPWVAPLTAWWLVPFLPYWAATRSRLASWLVGTGLLAAAVIGVIAVYRTKSSTAAVGLVTLPPLLFLAAVAAVIGERLILRLFGATHDERRMSRHDAE